VGNVLPIHGGFSVTIRMPAETTDVRVEVRPTGSYVVFETPEVPVEVLVGSDMMKALRIMKRCKQLLAARKTRGKTEEDQQGG
jgi:hypothetical protein